MARLERSLGLALLHRATTGTTLTTQGVLVVEWARATLAAARMLEAGVASLCENASSGDALVVMASQTVAEHLLPTWIAQWQSQPTHAAVTVSVGNTTQVLQSARRGDLDVGFIEGPGAPRGLNSVIVTHDDLVLVVAPHHPWAERAGVNADDVAATALVTREQGSGTRVALQRALAPRELAPPALELASNAAVRVSVSAGTAPGVLSRLAVTDALTQGILVEVPVVDVDFRRNLRAVWPGPRRMTNSAAEALLVVATQADAGAWAPSRG